MQHLDWRKLSSSLSRTLSHRFTSKPGIVAEEAEEAVFWLELLQEGNIFPAEKLRDLINEANELVSISVSSARAAKGPLMQS